MDSQIHTARLFGEEPEKSSIERTRARRPPERQLEMDRARKRCLRVTRWNLSARRGGRPNSTGSVQPRLSHSRSSRRDFLRASGALASAPSSLHNARGGVCRGAPSPRPRSPTAPSGASPSSPWRRAAASSVPPAHRTTIRRGRILLRSSKLTHQPLWIPCGQELFSANANDPVASRHAFSHLRSARRAG